MGPSATGWKIGEVSVTPVIELEMPTSADFILPDATPENLARHPWLRPHFVDDEGQLLMIVQALLVESRGRKIIVDTCIGNDKVRPIPDWNRMNNPFLADLAMAGFPREEVDLVVCTHLHVDHVGWNTMLVDDHWVPTFPNARYVVARPEWDYWREEDDQFFGDVLGDSVRPIFDAGLVDLVDVDHRLTEEVRLDPTPGHTPGHCSVIISSGSDEAVITGDLMHHPSQCAHPEWASSADVDANRARQTRRMFLARYAGSPVLVIGTHWGRPTAGHIVRDGDAWRFVV
jgi:glyoxylase-like metal-dependent hydrolase (beta-lactamase superfamily II)